MSKILWLSWKDKENPEAGGAEVIGHEIRKRLAKEGHTVVHLTSQFKGAQEISEIEGVKTIRLKAGKFTIGIKTAFYYLKNLKGQFDTIVEEVNTSPYLANYYKGQEQLFVLYHQLTGDVWDFESKFPMSIVGKYLLEPAALFLNRFSPHFIAMSDSTKKDMVNHGFPECKISILSEATDLQKLPSEVVPEKGPGFDVVFFGSLRKMKQPEETIKGFAAGLKGTLARLIIAGGAKPERIAELKTLAQNLGISNQVVWTGRISDEEKRKLFMQSHVLSATSVKEGWCIVVIEAGLLETPAVVYDVDGLRDSVLNKKTGIVVTNKSPEQFGRALRFLLENPTIRIQMGKAARAFNEQFSFERTYSEFKKIVQLD